MTTTALELYDPQIYELLKQEQTRQSGSLRLIPSENYVSKAVMQASGSCLTNKYSEGYPGKRYYEGQQVTDLIETIARDRAKKIFKADHANVQSYSGSVANLAAYNALIEPGDTVMGLSLPYGGHLTHGWKVSVTSKFYKSVQYTVRGDTGRFDYNQIEELAKKHRPKMIISGATAYPRAIDFEAFGRIAKSVGAFHLSDIAHISGTNTWRRRARRSRSRPILTAKRPTRRRSGPTPRSTGRPRRRSRPYAAKPAR